MSPEFTSATHRSTTLRLLILPAPGLRPGRSGPAPYGRSWETPRAIHERRVLEHLVGVDDDAALGERHARQLVGGDGRAEIVLVGRLHLPQEPGVILTVDALGQRREPALGGEVGVEGDLGGLAVHLDVDVVYLVLAVEEVAGETAIELLEAGVVVELARRRPAHVELLGVDVGQEPHQRCAVVGLLEELDDERFDLLLVEICHAVSLLGFSRRLSRRGTASCLRSGWRSCRPGGPSCRRSASWPGPPQNPW